jgi:hypothetical protein
MKINLHKKTAKYELTYFITFSSSIVILEISSNVLNAYNT